MSHHTLQTNPRHRDEDTHNTNTHAELKRQLQLSKHLSLFPSEMIARHFHFIFILTVKTFINGNHVVIFSFQCTFYNSLYPIYMEFCTCTNTVTIIIVQQNSLQALHATADDK